MRTKFASNLQAILRDHYAYSHVKCVSWRRFYINIARPLCVFASTVHAILRDHYAYSHVNCVN